jgi:hypothetical protein
MIKNKKHTMKGGRIDVFDFDNKNKNKNKYSVPKKFIYFTLNIQGKGDQKFKISQHTFAHFDEFTNQDLQNQILNFTHIMQYFVLFIFLLNSMKLTLDDFNSPTNCKSQKLKNTNTCIISKASRYNKENHILNIYIPKVNPSNEIFITSLFENNSGKEIKLNNAVKNIELKNNQITFTQNTINKLLDNEDTIKNGYDISFILDLLKDDYSDGSNSIIPSPQKNSVSSQPQQKASPPKVIIYNFSIPKVSGGKNHKTKSSKKRKNKRRGRKTRKSN